MLSSVVNAVPSKPTESDMTSKLMASGRSISENRVPLKSWDDTKEVLNSTYEDAKPTGHSSPFNRMSPFRSLNQRMAYTSVVSTMSINRDTNE